MVARAWGERERTEAKKLRPSQVVATPTIKRGVEEMFVQNETVSLCLLLNRRTRTMRVIDFRAGPSHAKRIFVLKLAKREGIEKVYTLVERDEVSTWVKLGFAKEANIAGFYKRSDAFILGCSVDDSALEQQLRVPIGIEEDDEPSAQEPSPGRRTIERQVDRMSHRYAETTLSCCVCGARAAFAWRRAGDHILGGPRSFQGVRCVRCGTARLDPRPSVSDMGRHYTPMT